MSVSRGFHTVIIAIIISLLFASACGSTTTARPTGTSSLALQSSAPVWGGDAQPATTDVVRGAITEQQAKAIAKACSDAPAELPNSGADTCEKKLQDAMPALLPCTIRDLCIEVVRVSAGQLAQPDGFIQIVEMRPGKPLCSSRPDGLCAAFIYRYDGLRPLIHSGGHWFLLPAGWTHSDSATVVILPDTASSIRVDLAP
jgi:hypothetical protein